MNFLRRKGLLKNAQLVDRNSGLCLGTPSLVDNVPGLVPCNEVDTTQRWDLSGVYGDYGYLEKPYLTNVESEFSDKPGRRIILPAASVGNPDQLNSTVKYDTVDVNVNYAPRIGKMRLDTNGNIRGAFEPDRLPNDKLGTDLLYHQPCLNVNAANAAGVRTVGHLRSKLRSYNDGGNPTDINSGNSNCDTQWDILVDCDTKTLNGMIADNAECDRKTGNWKCKPGFYGKKCDFADTAAKNQEDAYNRMFDNCRNGIITGMSNPGNCGPTGGFHGKQRWYTDIDKMLWYNNNFTLWNLVNTDDSNFNQQEIANKIRLGELDQRNDAEYSTKKKVYDDMVYATNTDKNNLFIAQTTRIADRTKALNEANASLAEITEQQKTYTVPKDNPDIVAAQKTIAIQKALIGNKNSNLQVSVDAAKGKLAALQTADANNKLELANLKKQLA